MFEESIRKVKNRKQPGPGKIHPELLKHETLYNNNTYNYLTLTMKYGTLLEIFSQTGIKKL